MPSTSVRPMQDKVKGALFSILGDRLRGAVCLDGFSGTGSIGLEALSRGAERVRLRRRVPALRQGHPPERGQVRGRGEVRRTPPGVQPGRHRPGQAGRPLRRHLPRPALPAARGAEPAQGHPQARRAQAGRAHRPPPLLQDQAPSSATSSSSGGWRSATTSSSCSSAGGAAESPPGAPAAAETAACPPRPVPLKWRLARGRKP
ncbi:MAG: RsmD family RNA methyltransferase [Desulfomicrobium escambiense]|nr:RsmD family RNA methyltransferase [Desulfomicrobium escambiense]